MTRRTGIPHLVILLPGIMGSVLQYEGRDLWALSGQAIAGVLRQMGPALEWLALYSDDLNRDILDDGIRATRLIEEIYDVPRLIKGSGYRTIQRELERAFVLETGDVENPQPHQNFFPFPYDWRRDIRASAGRLGRFIENQLPRWREYIKWPNAKVVIIAHSMGGLVARAYIELLGGFEYVELLYTLGTPHRGSPNALNALSNGLSVALGPLHTELTALTQIVRTFTSVYQLLPIYPVVECEGELVRVAELDTLPNIDQARALAAREVLVRIGDIALARRRENMANVAPTIPIVGFGQDTAQQALRQGNGTVTLSLHPLPGMATTDGDGTVPLFSAIPVEVQELKLATERFTNQHHGWLPNGTHTLSSLIADLSFRLDLDRAPMRGSVERSGRTLSVQVDDLYAVNEPVIIQARLYNTPNNMLSLVAQLTQVNGTERRLIALQSNDEAWSAVIEGLPAGLYQIEVRPQVLTPQGPPSVCTAFEVAER